MCITLKLLLVYLELDFITRLTKSWYFINSLSVQSLWLYAPHTFLCVLAANVLLVSALLTLSLKSLWLCIPYTFLCVLTASVLLISALLTLSLLSLWLYIPCTFLCVLAANVLLVSSLLTLSLLSLWLYIPYTSLCTLTARVGQYFFNYAWSLFAHSLHDFTSKLCALISGVSVMSVPYTCLPFSLFFHALVASPLLTVLINHKLCIVKIETHLIFLTRYTLPTHSETNKS